MKLLRSIFVMTGILACAGPFHRAVANDVIRAEDGPFISGGAFLHRPRQGLLRRSSASPSRRVISMTARSRCRPSFRARSISAASPRRRASSTALPRGRRWSFFSTAARTAPGAPIPTTIVTNALYDQGVHTLADFAKLKGKRIGVGALGSINQYNVARRADEIRASTQPTTCNGPSTFPSPI